MEICSAAEEEQRQKSFNPPTTTAAQNEGKCVQFSIPDELVNLKQTTPGERCASAVVKVVPRSCWPHTQTHTQRGELSTDNEGPGGSKTKAASGFA